MNPSQIKVMVGVRDAGSRRPRNTRIVPHDFGLNYFLFFFIGFFIVLFNNRALPAGGHGLGWGQKALLYNRRG
jgi:hypothetical protein